MGLSTAERNRRKRERKRREKEERRKQEQAEKEQAEKELKSKENNTSNEEDEIEIEYVVDPIMLPTMITGSSSAGDTTKASSSSIPDGLPPGMMDSDDKPSNDGSQKDQGEDSNMESILRRFHQRAAVSSVSVVSDDEQRQKDKDDDEAGNQDDDDEYDDEYEDDEYDDDKKKLSKRKWRELSRPTVAELKRRVKRPDLVEAHDITAADPDFLIHLKSISGTVVVPRHWGRKRKYLQGKRGFEKPPFQLPDFIIKTGITEIRDTVAEDEANQSAKQKNRSRVNPKMGSMDVDYKTLYEAFFKYQTKPTGLTKFGDLYYEGKELETSTDLKPGGPFSKALKEALAIGPTSPPPWLINMQRYGPPPSYPNLNIPGLNAPLPNDQCQYGYHTGGWGKPPVDAYNRPVYGGNPFDPPGSGNQNDRDGGAAIVTSDGKTIAKSSWGGLPTGDLAEEGDSDSEEASSSEEESDSSDEDMEESDMEDEDEPVTMGARKDGMESTLPPPPSATMGTAPGDLRKQPAGDETPMVDGAPKQLYQVLQTQAPGSTDGVFQSNVQYVVPGNSAAPVPEGAESVLSKAIAPSETAKRKRKHDDDDDGDLGKNFKF